MLIWSINIQILYLPVHWGISLTTYAPFSSFIFTYLQMEGKNITLNFAKLNLTCFSHLFYLSM